MNNIIIIIIVCVSFAYTVYWYNKNHAKFLEYAEEHPSRLAWYKYLKGEHEDGS